MYIPQKQLKNMETLVIPGKALIIVGARRVGKTTLLHRFKELFSEKVLMVNGDDMVTRGFLESHSVEKLKAFVGEHQLIMIDEAQYVKEIGLTLKLLVDHRSDLKVIATGSSSFDLAQDSGAPLAGRQYTLRLFPLAQCELSAVESLQETAAQLESRLVYGSYPEVVVMEDNSRRERYLRELVNAYLFKDILQFEGLRYADKLIRLLQLLAFQIGKEVSLSELGRKLGISKNTVERYLDLLEKVFVIYQLTGFSRNLRKEITKNRRYAFVDNGVRNALINNFNMLELRDDVGMLWENYILSERMKYREYTNTSANVYFWRTYDQKEIDLVEERGGRLCGYEIKWRKQKVRPPGDWVKAYPQAEYQVIHRGNYLDYIQ